MKTKTTSFLIDHKLINKLEVIHIKYCGGDDSQMITEVLKEVAKHDYHKDVRNDKLIKS